MECTKDIGNTSKTQKTNKEKDRQKENWTSKILKMMSKHKFITSIVAIFISFSIINIILIKNFMTILENSLYM